MQYQEIRNNVKTLALSRKQDTNTLIPKMISFQGDLSKKDQSAFAKKINANVQEFLAMPENTFEELRNKVGILLGTMYVNEYYVGWGEAYIPNEILPWAESLVNKYLPQMEQDEELYNDLKESGELDNFSVLMVNNKFNPDETESENVQSWKEILNDSLDEEKHYTIEIILGILFGWDFTEEIFDDVDNDDDDGDTFPILKKMLLK